MVTVLGSGHIEPNSNPAQTRFYLTYHLRKVFIQLLSLSLSLSLSI